MPHLKFLPIPFLTSARWHAYLAHYSGAEPHRALYTLGQQHLPCLRQEVVYCLQGKLAHTERLHTARGEEQRPSYIPEEVRPWQQPVHIFSILPFGAFQCHCHGQRTEEMKLPKFLMRFLVVAEAFQIKFDLAYIDKNPAWHALDSSGHW